MQSTKVYTVRDTKASNTWYLLLRNLMSASIWCLDTPCGKQSYTASFIYFWRIALWVWMGKLSPGWGQSLPLSSARAVCNGHPQHDGAGLCEGPVLWPHIAGVAPLGAATWNLRFASAICTGRRWPVRMGLTFLIYRKMHNHSCPTYHARALGRSRYICIHT